MYVILPFIGLILGIVAIVGIVNGTRLALDSNRKQRVESDKALAKAERALRSIANGAGAPVLEAQIALDEINVYHEKEIG